MSDVPISSCPHSPNADNSPLFSHPAERQMRSAIGDKVGAITGEVVGREVLGPSVGLVVLGAEDGCVVGEDDGTDLLGSAVGWDVTGNWVGKETLGSVVGKSDGAVVGGIVSEQTTKQQVVGHAIRVAARATMLGLQQSIEGSSQLAS